MRGKIYGQGYQSFSSSFMSATQSLLNKVNSSTIKALPSAHERKVCKQKSKAKDTAGAAWFHLPATPLTPELEKDLKVLSMRGALDRKQFYRGGEQPGKSKYFQIGTVVDNATGFYSDRLSKKMRPKSIVDTLLKDEESKAYYKKKFNDLQVKYKSGRKSSSPANGAGKASRTKAITNRRK
jgi:hypothetical protein